MVATVVKQEAGVFAPNTEDASAVGHNVPPAFAQVRGTATIIIYYQVNKEISCSLLIIF